MPVRLWPIAAALCLLAAGCTSAHHPAPSPSSVSVTVVRPTGTSTPAPTSTPTPTLPTVPADVPTTGPNLLHAGEKPPVMPVIATEHSQAGALAFAVFFELTTDWGFATTSSTYMKHYFQPTCLDCLGIQNGLDRAARAHEHYVGDRLKITRSSIRPGSGPHRAEVGVNVYYDVTSGEVLNGRNGYVDAEPATKSQDLIWLAWMSGSWIVVELLPVR